MASFTEAVSTATKGKINLTSAQAEKLQSTFRSYFAGQWADSWFDTLYYAAIQAGLDRVDAFKVAHCRNSDVLAQFFGVEGDRS